MTKPINKTSMFNVNRLIDSYMQECNYWFGRDNGMSEMYAADRNDFMTVRDLYKDFEYDKLVEFVHRMDTSPREDIVIAMAKDCGVAFVRDTFGYDCEGYA